jgi:heme-degrading monooxygenase HmoA
VLRGPNGSGAEVLMIVRIWRGWVATETRDDYVNYIVGTGLREYRETPGNLGAQMLTRDVGDGRTEVLTVSWWVSIESIRRFAGDDIELAKFYPQDEGYLIERETTVTHYDAASSELSQELASS